MSTPNDHSSILNYLCRDCGTINANGTICIHCRSNLLEEIPIELHDYQSTSVASQQQHSPSENNQTVLINDEFQNLFNNTNDIQTFSNMLLRMIMLQPQRRRRGRPSRRIKRATYPLLRHQNMPLINLIPFRLDNTQTPQISLFHINGLLSGQSLHGQLEPNLALVQLPLQFVLFDPNEANLSSDMLTQLLNEDMSALPLTRNDINQLPILTMNPSTLSVNPSCSICLENFDLRSEVKKLPVCHHVFHTNCLTEWLLRHGTCPMCRTSILNISWMKQIVSRPVQQQINNLSSDNPTPFSAIKTTATPGTSSNTIETNDSASSNIPLLPRFDSQVHTDSS